MGLYLWAIAAIALLQSALMAGAWIVQRRTGNPVGRYHLDILARAGRRRERCGRAAKVTVERTRVEPGDLFNVKGVGAGVQESRIDFGPGYRVYFGKDGDQLVILLAGGTKERT
jgi:putative addiction module killer protein